MNKNIRTRRNQQEEPKTLLESGLFKFITKSALALLIAVFLLTLIQCSVKEPQAPTWSSNLIIPVVNRTYTMEEFFAKMGQNGLGVDSQGTMTYSFDKELDTVTLSADILTTPDFSYSLNDSLGPVDIDPPISSPLLISLTSIGGLASGLPGDSVFIPATDFNIVNDVPTVSSYTTITIANGQLIAIVDNQLGIDLDTLIIQIFDLNLLKFVATDTFPAGLAGGTIDSLSISLDGETISSNLRLISYCFTQGGIVDSASTRYLTTSMAYSDIFTISSAHTEVPATTYNFSDQTQLGETELIESALLSSGSIQLSIDNGTNLDASITISIPDFTLNGTPLSITSLLLAQQINNITVDLSGYSLVPIDQTLPQSININMNTALISTGISKVLVNQNDNFQLTAYVTGLQFASISGKFNNQAADFSSVQQITDIPQGFDSLEFTNVQITLEVDNQIDLPGSLNITLTGNNGKSLNFSGNISPKGISNIFIGDSTVASFLSPIPSEITVTGTALMGASVYLGTIAAGDYVTATLHVYAPLAVVISDYTFESDIASESIDSSTADLITERLIQASLIYSIENRIPIGGMINIKIARDSLTLFSNPELSFDSLIIVPALVDSNGFASVIQSSGEQEIFIDSSDIAILSSGQFYVGHEITLLGSNGQTIVLNQNDYMIVTGRIEIEYLAGGSL